MSDKVLTLVSFAIITFIVFLSVWLTQGIETAKTALGFLAFCYFVIYLKDRL